MVGDGDEAFHGPSPLRSPFVWLEKSGLARHSVHRAAHQWTPNLGGEVDAVPQVIDAHLASVGALVRYVATRPEGTADKYLESLVVGGFPHGRCSE
jgi:hypothetical protein